jgi:hypothetical protein
VASRAEKQKRKKASLAISRAIAPADTSWAVELHARVRVGPKPAYAARQDGLAMLWAKGRISASQAQAGRTYGVLVRTAALTDGASIRSFLDIRPAGGGASGLPQGDLWGQAWVTECRWRLARAQAALNYHTAMIATLGLICGQGLHPREISIVQRETDQIETALRLALDMLIAHWEEQNFGGVCDWT